MPRVVFAKVDKKELEWETFLLTKGFKKFGSGFARWGWFRVKSGFRIRASKLLSCCLDFDEAFQIASYYESLFGGELDIVSCDTTDNIYGDNTMYF